MIHAQKLSFSGGLSDATMFYLAFNYLSLMKAVSNLYGERLVIFTRNLQNGKYFFRFYSK